MQKINFLDTDCLIDLSGKYNNGRQAIELIEEETHEPFLTASVNIPDYPLEEDEIAIKDYSENEGILMALVANNIVEFTGNFAPSGFVLCPIVKLVKHE